MKQDLAFSLIGGQMEWSDAKFADEFRKLQLMIDHKYDAYQGFQPATRFHIALLNWLSQFSQLSDKEIVYRLVRERLIFVSQREMHHLVSLTMPIFERHARNRVANVLGIPKFDTWTSPEARSRLDLMRRRTLYVGLSDGARIDVFRRYNEGIVSNEQVVAFAEISDEKWEDLQGELWKDLARYGPTLHQPQFEVVCLIDDFSGSGSSLLRWQHDQWKGKVKKFYDANHDKVGVGKMLATDCVLHIHHHLASQSAKSQIEADISAFAKEHPGFRYVTSFSYVLPQNIVISDSDADSELVELLKRWYDQNIEDEHTKENIWFGYKQCGLPLILEHNTPNNSIALLWAASAVGAPIQMKPLFARRKRHSSNG